MNKKYFYKKFKYKELLRFREPIHENYRILNFKRSKWMFLKKTFIFKFLKSTAAVKKFQNKKLKFNFYYPTGHTIPNRWTNLKFAYREKLLSKTKLLYFYGLNTITKKKNQNFYKTSLLPKLETRLDIFLWRANIFSTPGIARFYITHQNIYINSRIVNLYQYSLTEGDIITFSLKLQKQLKVDFLSSSVEKKLHNKLLILKKRLNNILPFYCEINNDLLAIVYVIKFTEQDISKLPYLYHTNLNVEKVIQYLK